MGVVGRVRAHVGRAWRQRRAPAPTCPCGHGQFSRVRGNLAPIGEKINRRSAGPTGDGTPLRRPADHLARDGWAIRRTGGPAGGWSASPLAVPGHRPCGPEAAGSSPGRDGTGRESPQRGLRGRRRAASCGRARNEPWPALSDPKASQGRHRRQPRPGECPGFETGVSRGNGRPRSLLLRGSTVGDRRVTAGIGAADGRGAPAVRQAAATARRRAPGARGRAGPRP